VLNEEPLTVKVTAIEVVGTAQDTEDKPVMDDTDCAKVCPAPNNKKRASATNRAKLNLLSKCVKTFLLNWCKNFFKYRDPYFQSLDGEKTFSYRVFYAFSNGQTEEILTFFY
jgi:hypothetical protein